MSGDPSTPSQGDSTPSGGGSFRGSPSDIKRTDEICAYFNEAFCDAESGFRCNLCKTLVQDKDPSKGPTGRCGHLKTKHKTQYATIKAPRKRKLRGEDDEDTMEKFTREDIVLWMARRLHPAEELNDPLVKNKKFPCQLPFNFIAFQNQSPQKQKDQDKTVKM